MSLRQWCREIGGITGAVAVCALGRGLDFATTWVAIGRGRAFEAEPFARHVLHVFGQHAGLITYEAMITTPAIFLGCRLATRMFGNRSAGDPNGTSLGERMFFVSIGVISLIVASFNVHYLI
ncbi:MAG TPA: hypothetical protein VMP11_10355 [Verrucomicrobiae bacterium]|nr:hypothetical protein [Verrucomicrobiae bacterium]